ncbi:NUDIX domain-containing protein [Streptomyces sp. NPDC000594]|uniref:NUDIX domain-containing protein n=1 Tax=Streptomyces sp. NPDC000594 TaxID=3154261 RepID=UPI0033317E89
MPTAPTNTSPPSTAAPPRTPCDAAAVVSHQGWTLLVLGRRARGELVWQFPAGRVGDGEQPQEAAVRGVREVTGVDAVAVQVLGDHGRPGAPEGVVHVGCSLAASSRAAYVAAPQRIAGTAWIADGDLDGYLAATVTGPVRRYLGLDRRTVHTGPGGTPAAPPRLRTRTPGTGERVGVPALFLPSGGDLGLAVLRHTAAGGSLWEAARALGTAYWDVRDALLRTARGLCPELPLMGTFFPVPRWLVRPVTRAVARGLITTEHVPAPAGAEGPLVLDGADRLLAEFVTGGLGDVQIARRLGRTADENTDAVRTLQRRAAASNRAHLAAVLLLHATSLSSSDPAVRPQPSHRQDP